MIGCDSRRRLPPAAGLLLIAGLVTAQNLQAAAVRACPHHGGSEHSVAAGPAEDSGAGAHHGAPQPAAPHPGHSPSPGSDSDSHEGPCDCLGPCGASAAVHAPALPGESSFAEAVPRRAAVPDATELGRPRLSRSYVLPYPNAPPA